MLCVILVECRAGYEFGITSKVYCILGWCLLVQSSLTPASKINRKPRSPALQVCHTLLPTLVHRKPLCRRLISLPSWQALATAFSQRQAALTTHLSQKFQRALSRCLCLAASGFGDEAAAQQYVSHLMLQTVNELVGLAGRQQQQLAAAAQRAEVQLQVRIVSICDSACTAANRLI